MTTTTPQVLPGGQSLDAAIAEATEPTNWTANTSSTPGRRRPQITPMTIVASEGSYVWDGGATPSRTLLSWCSRNIDHQHPKVVAAIAERAAKLCARAAARQRCPVGGSGPADRRAHPGDLDQGVLHQRWRRRDRARGRMAAAHRPAQGARVTARSTAAPDTAINLTGDPRRYPTTTAAVSCTSTAVPVPVVVQRRDQSSGSPSGR